MLGTYRLVLALLVALSHAGVVLFGMNSGVVAVVGFYIVSGYVMTGLLRTAYPRVAMVARFYADRLLRIGPHYLAIAAITAAWFAATGARTEYLRITPGVRNFAENLLVVPLNFFMFNGADRFMLIPPAWSLGAEIQFYLLIPALVLLGARAPRLVAAALSVAVYVAASFGVVQSEWYGFRLLPGVLFMFLIGSALYDAHRAEHGWQRGAVINLATIGVVAIVALLVHRHGALSLPYDVETLAGLVVGVTAVNVLGQLRRRRIDEAAGTLSYGIFLNHYLVLWIVFGARVTGWVQAIVFLSTAAVFAFVMYRLVERPVLDYRRRLRERTAAGARAKVDAGLATRSAATVGSLPNS